MEMTPEIKKAFRVAYDVLAKSQIPAGDELSQSFMFDTIGMDITAANRQNQDNPLVKHLLYGIYNYLEEMSKK